MVGITLSIAIAACILILVLRPVHALIVYLAVIIFYPTYLVVSIGTVDITVHRIVASTLLLKYLTKADLLRKFNWCRLDTWVTVYIFVCTMMMFITSPFEQAIVNRGGFIIDTLFLYMIVRLCVTKRTDVLTVAKWTGILLVPLAVLGAVEALTGYQPFAGLAANAPWALSARFTFARYGLTRAVGTCGHPIMFGLSFCVLLPLVYYLRHQKNYWQVLAYVLSGVALVGALSSMSGVPLGALMAIIVCLVMESFKQYVKLALVGLMLCVILAGIGSNRPIYHVVFSYANPLGGAGWHRAKLIDLAIEHFDEWYLLGYGGRDPGWGPQLGSGHTDITNEFLFTGVKYGVLGIIVLCCILGSAMRLVIFLHGFSKDPMVKSLAWALGSILVGITSAFLGVSIMGQMIFLFYFVLGMIGSSTNLIAAQSNSFRTSQIIPRRLEA